MAFWALDIYFPQWECLNYGAPGEGLAYVESFAQTLPIARSLFNSEPMIFIS